MILLRSALFNLYFYLLTACLTLPATVVRLVAPERVLSVGMLWARLVIAGVRIICGISFEVTGLEYLPRGPALIASAHQSAFDTVVWLTLLPRCCYVLKQELTRIPLFGPLLSAARMIAVDRRAGASALRQMLRSAEDAVRDNRQIVIFPEGTRSEPGVIGALQPGVAALAARTGLPVIPVATDSGLFWSRRAFIKRPGVIRIILGAPIPAATPREALMQILREQIDIRTYSEAFAADLL